MAALVLGACGPAAGAPKPAAPTPTGTPTLEQSNADSCSAVVPAGAIPEPVHLSLKLDDMPKTDGEGTAALLPAAAPGAYYPDKIWFYRVDDDAGRELGAYSAPSPSSFTVMPKASGFLIAVAAMAGTTLEAVDHIGRVTGESTIASGMSRFADDGADGAFGLTLSAGATGGVLRVTHYGSDAAADASSIVSTSAFDTLALAANSKGHVIAMWQEYGASGWHFQWFDRDAKPLSAAEPLVPSQNPQGISTVALGDGSLALFAWYPSKAAVLGVMKDAATTLTDAPKWVATNQVLIRGGSGYANQDACGGLRLRTLAGTDCGCILIDPSAGMIDVGRDGSVFVMSATSEQTGVDWYPGLLR